MCVVEYLPLVAYLNDVQMGNNLQTHSITSESSVNASVNTDLLPYVSNVSISLKRVFQDNQISETADATHLQDFEEDVKALVQESLWFLNMHKISRGCEEEMRGIVQNVETQMRRIIAVDVSECVSVHFSIEFIQLDLCLGD